MKSPGGGSKSGGFPSGPSLTPAQKAKRDRGEAKKAHGEAEHAREEARKAGKEARKDESRARADRKRGEGAFARQEMKQARADLARQKRDLARAGRDEARSKRDLARARTAGLARAGRPGEWILGGNDQYLTCATAAVANSLLLATGKRASDDDVLNLHQRAGGTEATGTSVLDVLETAQRYGLAGVRAEPICESAARLPGSMGSDRSASVILELGLPDGVHAVLFADGFAVTWGQAVPVTQAFLVHHVLAAWQVTWGGV